MDGLNKVYIVGNLGADPELRMNPGGHAVLKLRVATNESWLDKEKVRREKTEWHRVTVFGKSAENLAKFLRKGMGVSIEGRNQTSTYEKEGQKHYSTEVVASRVWVASPRTAATEAGAEGDAAPFAPPPTQSNGAYGQQPSTLTDIPF